MFSPDAGTAPPVNFDPSQGPVGQAPNQVGPVTAFASQALAPTSAPPPPMADQGPQNPPLVGMAQQASGRPMQFDPMSNAGRLAALGFDPDVLSQMMVQNGWVDPSMMQRRMM